MTKRAQTIAVVRRKMNGKDPIGCGLGAGRASELLGSVVNTSRAELIVGLTSWGKRRWHFVSSL